MNRPFSKMQDRLPGALKKIDDDAKVGDFFSFFPGKFDKVVGSFKGNNVILFTWDGGEWLIQKLCVGESSSFVLLSFLFRSL